MAALGYSSHSAQRSIVLGLYLRGEQPPQAQCKALELLRQAGLIQRLWPRWLWALTPKGAALCRDLCNPARTGPTENENA